MLIRASSAAIAATFLATQALPVSGLHTYAELPADMELFGKKALAQTVICKLNGGLGTSMGLDGPKSLLPVKDGLTFLDITARQVLRLRRTLHMRLPLLLMNSFATHTAHLRGIRRLSGLPARPPPGFVQNKAPKVARGNLPLYSLSVAGPVTSSHHSVCLGSSSQCKSK